MEEYRLVLESQLGPREGDLRLEEENGMVRGTLILLGFENAVCGQRVGESRLRLTHHLHTQVSDLECVSVFELENGKLSGTLKNGQNTMLWHGEKVEESKGEDKRNAGE